MPPESLPAESSPADASPADAGPPDAGPLESSAAVPGGPHSARPPEPTARRRGRFGLGALFLVGLISAAVAIVATRWLVRAAQVDVGAGAGDPGDDMPTMYQCPMHPSIIQDHPGNCPICGMRLVKMHPTKAADGSAPTDKPKLLFYRSPMDPKQTSPTPRKDEMGMDYVAVYEGETGAASTVPGLATVEIDPARQQLIGLTTALVTRGPIGGAWRTVGRVAVDETRVRHVNLKVSGFVDRVYVDFVGKKVKRGDPLFSMYSPELLAAQEEYLLALRTRQALAQPDGVVGGDGDVLVAAARRKLALWDVSAAELARLARTGEPTKNLMFYSPAAGVVTKKDVVEGMKLDAGAMPYEIVDLSSVWVLADVYESELRFVTEGMTGTLELAAFPDREFQGRVIFVDPMLDPRTRTVKVRLAFANPVGELRPELFGEVVLHGPAREALRMPLDAVIDSGTRKVVMVAIGAGKFEPREVELGTNDGTQVEVLRGVNPGERVVTRANFLVDSESRLRASLAELAPQATAPDRARVLPESPASSPPPAGTAEPRP